MQISDPEIRHQHTYGMVLSRCHINCGHADQVNFCQLFYSDGTSVLSVASYERRSFELKMVEVKTKPILSTLCGA